MKRNTNITAAVWALLMTLAFACALTGCEQLIDPNGKTPLDTPANVRVDDAGKTAFTLKWDAVEGADSYTLDIDGTRQSVSATSYDLRALTEDPRVYPIKVRAVAYNGDITHSDSEFSAPLNVEPAEYVFIFTDEDEVAPSPSVQPGRNIARAAGENGTITGLTNYGKGLERIIIPPRIGSITITAIGDEAFKDNPVMTAISLPETLITIGAGALSGTNISSIIIPESVLTIGDGAFANIIVLVVVVFVSPEPPALGDGVFTGSEAIETIVVPDGKGTAYKEMIEEAAPELAETIEEAKEEKILIGIEVVQPPKTEYAEGEQFSNAGMTVIARYSDNTTSPVTNYTVLLQTYGGFSAESRALTAIDTAVRLSYTEGDITRTTTIAITVTGQTSEEYKIYVEAGDGGTITTDPSGGAAAGTRVTVTVTPDEGYTLASVSVTSADGSAIDGNVNSDGLSGYFTMPASDVTITGTFEATGGSSGGTFTLNNIPSEYNGKYAYLGTFGYANSDGSSSGGDDVALIGAVSIDMEAQTAALPQIVNGSVSIPMWIMSDNGTIARYSGNNTADIYVGISNTATFDENSESEGAIYFELVVFANGNAAKSWSDGRFEEGGGEPVRSYNITVTQATGGTITTDPSDGAPAETTVTITVTPDQGYTFNSSSLSVTTIVAGSNGTTDIDYQTSANGGYTFTMPDSDVVISGTFSTGGGPVGPDPGKTITVAFEGFGDESIDLTTNTNNDVSMGGALTATVTGSYTSYQWYMDGSSQSIGSYYAISIPISQNVAEGEHTLAVVVVKDGIPYSKEVTFRVVR
jgi:hypothetical protein